MNVKTKVYDFLQKQFGGITEDFLSDLKIIIRGKLNLQFVSSGIKIWFGPSEGNKSAYLVIVDKSSNKDITKIKLPLRGHIIPKANIEIPIELKMDIEK